MKEVVIVAAVRTPMGSWGGALKDLTATRLGAIAVKAALERAGLKGEDVDELLMGCVLQANLGQAPARQVSRFSGLPDDVICTTVNKVCASGMKAVSQGAQAIMLGDADVIIAGGMESMSNVPYYNTTQRWGNKFGDVSMIDGLAHDGLTDVYHSYAMGNAAELCAKECNVSREDQDAFAIQSFRRSQAAWDEGRFADEVVPVEVPQRNGETLKIEKDEQPWNVKWDKIPKLKSAFTKDGSVTAANSSTMNDGAAALVLMAREKADELGIKPIAVIRGYADVEQAPEWFTTAPSVAIPKALKKAGLTMDDVDYVELNEAFSVVGIENMRRLKITADKVNMNGGAISLGHPLGASGARIVVTLINVLKQNGGKIGVAGICNGGGGGSAMVIELA